MAIRTRAPAGRRDPGRGSRRGLALIIAALSLAAACAVPLATARPVPAQFTGVEAIYQSNVTYPGSRFVISVEVADPSAVTFAYFTFCQLTSSECYAPDVLHHTTGGWYMGNTSEMSQYGGMVAGVQAGYNITIEYSNDTNVTLPTLPNAFPALTIASTVAGEYTFEMSVSPVLFGLSGVVRNATTDAAVAGAAVAISPGDLSTTTGATGAYAFSGLANGTYSLTVTAAGFTEVQQKVVVSGQNATQNVTVTSASTSNGTPPPSHPAAGTPGWTVWVVGAAVAAAVIAAVALALRRRAGRTAPSKPGAAPSAVDGPAQAPSGGTEGPPDRP